MNLQSTKSMGNLELLNDQLKTFSDAGLSIEIIRPQGNSIAGPYSLFAQSTEVTAPGYERDHILLAHRLNPKCDLLNLHYNAELQKSNIVLRRIFLEYKNSSIAKILKIDNDMPKRIHYSLFPLKHLGEPVPEYLRAQSEVLYEPLKREFSLKSS